MIKSSSAFKKNDLYSHNLYMNVYNCFIYLLTLGHATRLAGSLFFDQGLNMHSQQWKCRALTTGLSGDSRHLAFCSLHLTDGEKVEIVTYFPFLGFKITADGDRSHEIRRWLFLGRKAMTNLNSILKSVDTTLPAKVRLVKAIVFPVVMYRFGP